MNSTSDTLREQSRAIQKQSEKKPEPLKETAREGRWRVERERKDSEDKKHPERGY